MKELAAFTIVNNAYMNFAQVCAESYLDKVKDGTFYIFLLDDFSERPDIDKRIIILDASHIGIEEFIHRAFYYNITELATSIKPDAMLFLIRSGYRKVIYLDPDILILAPLQKLIDELHQYNIMLTPHILEPLPTQDGLRPNEFDLLRTGTYNLGFIAVNNSEETVRFLMWWADRLKFYSFEEYEAGLYTDQKWINLAVTLFNGVHVMNNPGYNVAYWNLSHRSVRRLAGQWTVNEKFPLVFFHFSGIDIQKREISKNQNRIEIGELSDLEELFSFYRHWVKQRTTKNKRKYKYNYFLDGTEITPLQRRLYFNMYINRKIHSDPFTMSWRNIVEEGFRTPQEWKIISQNQDVLSRAQGHPVLHRLAMQGIKSNFLTGKSMSNIVRIAHLITSKTNFSELTYRTALKNRNHDH